MPREKTIKEIVQLRKRFTLLIVGRSPGEVYRELANEYMVTPQTISMKINLYGAYRDFKSEIMREERLVNN